MTKTSRPLTVTALLLAIFMGAMEATVVGTAMPTIVGELGGLAYYGWVGSAYLLASTVAVPIYGKLADLYGRKPILIVSTSVFLVGSVACGATSSIFALIAARTVQGLGAGGMQPTALTVVGDLYSVEERGKIQGFFGAVWAVAGIAGPLLGAFLVHVVSWRAVFLVNVPFGLLSMAVLARALEEKRLGVGPVSIDWAGALVLTAASVLLLVGAGGNVGAAAAGVLCTVLFVAVERRAKDPILSLELLALRPIAVGAVASALFGAAMMGTLLYVPLYVQGVLGRSPAEAGAAITPMLIGWPLSSTLTGRLLARTGFRAPVWVGSVIVAASLVAFVAVVGGSGGVTGGMHVAMFAYGVGMGIANTAVLVAVQSSVGWGRRGVVTATNMFARTMGGAMGVGALGAVLARRLGASLSPETVAAVLDPSRRGAAMGTQGAELSAALARGLAPVFWATAALGVVNLGVVAVWPRRLQRASDALPSVTE